MTQLRDAYITGAGAFLPGRQPAGSNTGLCAKAVRAALDDAGLGHADLDFLAATASQGDGLAPDHDLRGALGGEALEVASFQNGSALMAAKAAWLSIRAGEHDVAAACAGEASPSWMRSPACRSAHRFDGAGAIVIEPAPQPLGLSLRIDHIDVAPLAGAFEPRAWAWAYLQKVEAGRIRPHAVDWLLCHCSAPSLRDALMGLLDGTAGAIPRERWFQGPSAIGDVGSASIWAMLDELMKSGRLERGQRVLCMTPEGGRSLMGFMMLEAV